MRSGGTTFMREMVQETFFKVNGKTKNGRFARIDITDAAIQREIAVSATGVGSLPQSECDPIRQALVDFSGRFQRVRLDVKDPEDWTTSDEWKPEAEANERSTVQKSTRDGQNRTRNADITLEDESSGDEFPDSASVAAAKKADSKAPNYRPRPFRASHNDTHSRVSGRSIEDQPPWTGILTAIQNASDANWRLNNLKQFVTSLVAIIQCPADPTQGQGNRSTQNQETSQSSVTVSQAPPQRYKRTISNDNNSGDERDDEDRRKRRFNQTPSDSHTINFLQIPCPFSKNIPGKLTRKRKNGPTPTQQPVLCKQEFESMEELRNHLRDHHRACIICLPLRLTQDLLQEPKTTWHFSNDHCLRQHINAVHFKHCWVPCDKCKDVQSRPIDDRHWQWKICKGCRKGDNRGAQAAKNITEQPGSVPTPQPGSKKLVKKALSQWYPELERLHDDLKNITAGAAMEKLLLMPDGKPKYNFEKSIDNLPGGFQDKQPQTSSFGQTLPTPTPTTLFDGSHDSPPPPPPGTSGHSEHQQIRSILEQNNWTSRVNMRNPAPGNMTQIRAYPSPPHVFETMPLEIEQQTRSGEEDILELLNFITPPNGAGTPLQIDTTSPHMGRSPAGLQTEVYPAPRLPEHPTYVRRHINRSISATAHAGEESEVVVASGIHGPRALPGVTPACIGKLCDEKPDFRKELLKMLYDKYAQDIWQIMAERGDLNDSGVDVSADDVPTRFVEELNTTAAQNSRIQPSMGGALFNPDYSEYQRTNQSNESASVESGALNFSDDDDDAHTMELAAQWMHHDPMPDVGYGMN